MYRALYRDNLTLDEARVAIDALVRTHPLAAQDVALMTAFLAQVNPQRGIVR